MKIIYTQNYYYCKEFNNACNISEKNIIKTKKIIIS